MGKNRTPDCKPIDSIALRNVTYCKRKRGLIKKAMELSAHCI